MARLPLVVAALVVAGGIAAGVMRPVPDRGGSLLIPAALAGGVAAAALMRPRPTGRSRGTTPLFLLLASAGVLLGNAARSSSDRSCLRWLPDGVPLRIHGVAEAVDSPRALLDADSVGVGGRTVACGSQVPVRWGGRGGGPGRGPGGELVAGRRVVVAGRWWSPPGPRRVLGRAGTFLVDSVSAPGGGDAVPATRGPLPDRARRAARARVDALYGARAPLAASLLLAQRDALDRDVREQYARAGLSHLLAISGLHVGLVAGILLLLASLLRLGARAGPVAAAVGTLAYVAFLGAPHSAVRAALQIGLLLAARMLQRPTRSAALMAAAALTLLVAEPGAILSPGFQLSFAGVAGILGLRRPLLRALTPLTGVRVGRFRVGAWLGDGLATSVAATLATAPIVAWHFGRLAPIGILANLAAIPLLGLTIPALAVPLLVSTGSPAAGAFLARPGLLLMGLLDATAELAAGVPWGTAAVTGPGALLVTGSAVAGWAVARRAGRVRRSVRVVVWAGVAGIVLLVAPLRAGGDRLELHMIDVGQGDAIALRTPAGRWLLVDAGIGGRDYDAGARRVVPYLARRGVRRLEALVLTHPDADHAGGAAAVIAALRPRWVGDPGVAAAKEQYLGLLEAAGAARVPWVGLARGVVVEIDGVTVEVLAPDRVALPVDDANDASVVARVEYGRFSALLTGDAPAEVERRLVARHGRRMEAELLKVGHHGSATSTTPELLDSLGTRYALVSAGRGNRYGHPHPSVIRRLTERGVRILRSDRNGSVVVRADRTGHVDVEMERGGGG